MYSSRSSLIIGFHGCDEEVAIKLITNPKKVKTSNEEFDWLGHGFYVWENNFSRALQWAKDKEKRGAIRKAAVVGVVLTLDNCLDLIDSEFINYLSDFYKLMENEFQGLGIQLPENRNVEKDAHQDLLVRNLDCAVIEYLHLKLREEGEKEFDTARGVFTEGGPAFPGAGIQKKSHIQICVRNLNCIKGFFLPRN